VETFGCNLMFMLAEECIHYWISAAPASEAHVEELRQSIDLLIDLALSRSEADQLKALLERRQVGLVRRYIELKLSDCPLLASDLDRGEEALLDAIASASLIGALSKWLALFSISIDSVDGATLIQELQRKAAAPSLSVKGRYLLIELVEALAKQVSPLDYLHRLASHTELLLFFEEELQALIASLHAIPTEEVAELRLELFEKTLVAFHQECGMMISTQILPCLEPYARASWVGTFRLLFEEINSTYNALKSRITKTPCDLHLTCLCHFAPAINDEWPFNNRVLRSSSSSQKGPERATQGSILIFTCGGGSGHLTASQAMVDYCRGNFHPYVVSTLEETLAPADPLRKIRLNFSKEKLYNHLLKNEEYPWIKLVTSMGPLFVMLQQEKLEKLIRLEIWRHSPDLLISCFPIFNGLFLKIAKEFDLPFLLITTDLDASHFAKGMQETDYPRYKLTLAYDDPDMRALVARYIPQDKIAVSGFPLRPSFHHRPSTQELKELRSRYQIGEEETVILVMMGGNPCLSTEKYAQILAQFEESDLDLPLRVLCLCGDQTKRENRKTLRRINQLVPRHPRMKIQGLPALEQVAELMDLADLLITKPGGCTTNEALAKGLPMIFHAPFALMDWEIFNMEFCIRHKMGRRFRMHANSVGLFRDGLTRNKERLLPLIKDCLKHSRQHNTALSSKLFGEEFLKLCHELIG
jgi:processive 1,2-diacylglycerol beta-glucosyltransferase